MLSILIQELILFSLYVVFKIRIKGFVMNYPLFDKTLFKASINNRLYRFAWLPLGVTIEVLGANENEEGLADLNEEERSHALIFQSKVKRNVVKAISVVSWPLLFVFCTFLSNTIKIL